MELVFKHDTDGSVMEQLVPLIDLNGFISNGWVLERLSPIAEMSAKRKSNVPPTAA
jgi:hypothetical protein